jgi:hypothetical protein
MTMTTAKTAARFPFTILLLDELLVRERSWIPVWTGDDAVRSGGSARWLA